MARLGAALALALLLPAPTSEAQSSPSWRAPSLPGVGTLAPPLPPPAEGAPPPVRRGAPQVPNYYLERGAPVAKPKAPLSPAEIANSLRARGFNNIGPVERRGNTSITRARGPGGEEVQLVIGPNGDIVGVRVLQPEKYMVAPGSK